MSSKGHFYYFCKREQQKKKPNIFFLYVWRFTKTSKNFWSFFHLCLQIFLFLLFFFYKQKTLQICINRKQLQFLNQKKFNRNSRVICVWRLRDTGWTYIATTNWNCFKYKLHLFLRFYFKKVNNLVYIFQLFKCLHWQ